MSERAESRQEREHLFVCPDDSHVERTGTVMTTSAHIITVMIGPGILSVSWAISQLGWILGPSVLLLFAFVTYYTSKLLAACYRSGNPVLGQRNCTYSDAVRATLGWRKAILCRATQYSNLVGVAIRYNIGAALSIGAIVKSVCFNSRGINSPCNVSSVGHNFAFGVVQLFFSQIPSFHQLSWLSMVSAAMCIIYPSIIIGLAVGKLAETREFSGTLTGIPIGMVTGWRKTFNSLQAVGDIMFANLLPLVITEIQDTLKSRSSTSETTNEASPSSELEMMKKASRLSLSVITILYVLCGFISYAAFGDFCPTNVLTDFGFHKPHWLLAIANAAVVIHHIGAYQVCSQPIFAFIEKTAKSLCPDCAFINDDIPILRTNYKLNRFRVVSRCVFVTITTLMSLLMPAFIDALGVLGAVGHWRLTVRFPVAMYIAQKKIPKCSKKWIYLQLLSMSCLAIHIAAAVGSFVGLISDFRAKFLS